MIVQGSVDLKLNANYLDLIQLLFTILLLCVYYLEITVANDFLAR